MKMIKKYPSFSDLEDELSKEDLIMFITEALEGKNISDYITAWIEYNYEYKLVEDIDAAYDEYKDREI